MLVAVILVIEAGSSGVCIHHADLDHHRPPGGGMSAQASGIKWGDPVRVWLTDQTWSGGCGGWARRQSRGGEDQPVLDSARVGTSASPTKETRHGPHSDRSARHEGSAAALHAWLARGQPHLR